MAAGLAALVALPVLGGSAGAVAPRTPSGSTPAAESLSLNIFGSGAIRGMTLIGSGSPGRVRYAFHGLPATGALRAVASTKPCSQPHAGSAKVLGWSLGASNPTSAGQFMIDLAGANAGAIRSVRVFRGAGTGVQRACSNTSHWEVAPPSYKVTFEDVLISSFLSKPGPRGLAALEVVDEDTVRVRAELLHKDRGTFRLVGSTKPCSQAHTGASKVFSVGYSLGDTGTHEVGHVVDATRPLAKPIDAIRSIRVMAKNEVAMETIECRGIIAILIGL
jgi:hypothetical protein